MIELDGTPQKTSDGHQKRLYVHQPIRMGATPCAGETDGNEQGRAHIGDSNRENPYRESKRSNRIRNTGKLIERIQLLQDEYESGLSSDMAALDALLKTMAERKKRFDASVDNLKQEVRNLLIQEDK